MPQIKMMLNLLGQSNVILKVSAYAYMNGPHDYNELSLASLVCSVQLHDKPNKRMSWDVHSTNGWYIKTKHENYRFFRVYRKETRAEMVLETGYFKHKYITMSTVTKADVVVQVAKELPQAIEKNATSALPATNWDVLRRLTAFYDGIVQKKPPDTEWEKPASPDVLELAECQRVT